MQAWSILKAAVLSFINDEALSRGAAMAFFVVTSLAPILLIVVAIAGLVFGREAAQDALAAQLTGVMGGQSAQLIQSATANAANQTSGTWAAVIGLVTLLVTASGVFGEMQSALNVIWKAEPKRELNISAPLGSCGKSGAGGGTRLPADCFLGHQRSNFGLR